MNAYTAGALGAVTYLVFTLVMVLRTKRQVRNMTDFKPNEGPWESCPDCGSSNVVEEEQEYEFPYGADGPDQAKIKVKHPVFMCKDCGCGVSDYRGEEARTAAIEAYLESKKG